MIIHGILHIGGQFQYTKYSAHCTPYIMHIVVKSVKLQIIFIHNSLFDSQYLSIEDNKINPLTNF